MRFIVKSKTIFTSTLRLFPGNVQHGPGGINLFSTDGKNSHNFFAGSYSYYPSSEDDVSLCLALTLLLFPPLPPVADLDGADAHNDGHDEEEDSANQAGSDGAPLHVLRHCISGQSLWCSFIFNFGRVFC